LSENWIGRGRWRRDQSGGGVTRLLGEIRCANGGFRLGYFLHGLHRSKFLRGSLRLLKFLQNRSRRRWFFLAAILDGIAAIDRCRRRGDQQLGVEKLWLERLLFFDRFENPIGAHDVNTLFRSRIILRARSGCRQKMRDASVEFRLTFSAVKVDQRPEFRRVRFREAGTSRYNFGKEIGRLWIEAVERELDTTFDGERDPSRCDHGEVEEIFGFTVLMI